MKYLLGLAIVIHNKIKKKGLLHQFLYPFLTGMTETAFSKVVFQIDLLKESGIK